MGKIFAIICDLKSKSHDYSCLFNQLTKSNWCHYIQSTWLIETDDTVEQIWNRIEYTIDRKDFVLIIEVHKNYRGQLPADAWNWINERVKDMTLKESEKM